MEHKESRRYQRLARNELGAAIGMGIGAMCSAMLRLPLTSTLLAVVLMGAAGVMVTPEALVAGAIAFVISNVLPVPGSKTPESPSPYRSDARGGNEAAGVSSSAT